MFFLLQYRLRTSLLPKKFVILQYLAVSVFYSSHLNSVLTITEMCNLKRIVFDCHYQYWRYVEFLKFRLFTSHNHFQTPHLWPRSQVTLHNKAITLAPKSSSRNQLITCKSCEFASYAIQQDIPQ